MKRWLMVVLVFAVPWAAEADEAWQTFVEQTVTAARDKHGVPAIAALVQVNGKVEARFATGVRAVDQSERVTVDDRWHLGSDSKAITATLIARLVELKLLSFDDTLPALFPAFAQEIDAAYRSVTLAQLLSHTAGLPGASTDRSEVAALFATINAVQGVKAQREAVARTYLAKPPAGKQGTFVYSNVGYMIAGAAAEKRTGKTWEELLREFVFAPLGITHAGFGAPSTPGKFDQPLGHIAAGGKLTPLDPAKGASDNPAALGPAGTIHMPLDDWARFVQDQLDGARGRGKLLQPETYRRLQTPASGDYAFGWAVQRAADGTPIALVHAGSNGFWFAYVQVLLTRGSFLLVAMNAASPPASREIATALAERLKQ